jgi:hypothetical protein
MVGPKRNVPIYNLIRRFDLFPRYPFFAHFFTIGLFNCPAGAFFEGRGTKLNKALNTEKIEKKKQAPAART